MMLRFPFRFLLPIAVAGFLCPGLAAQAPDGRPKTAPAVTITRFATPIRVDGHLDEPEWAGAATLSLDWEWTPGDNAVPPVRTLCRLGYDADNLYFGCTAADPDPKSIRARLLDRDDTERLVLDDHLLIMIDPFNDQRRAFQFRVNPLGAQADAINSMAEGYEDFSWDAIWSSAGRLTDQGYEVEIAIPFRSLRFPKGGGTQTWGMIIERSYPRSLRHRMQAAPRDRNNQCVLCEANKVTGFEGISSGKNMELVPTATAAQTDTRPGFPGGPLENGKVKADVGADLRVSLTPNLALNATANPDFSQVEADVAQLDVNTRFALFYPEKRPFFLEGADFFGTPVNAVFTRTVADPDAGLKLSGKVGKSTRSAVGFFAARDRNTNLLFPSNQKSQLGGLEQPSYVTVGRFRRDLGASSYVGALYTGRFGDGYGNHVGGFDLFQRLSRSSQIRAQYLVSNTEYPDSTATAFGQPKGKFGGGAFSAELNHLTQNWSARVIYTDLSPDFRADVGFVPRVDARTGTIEVVRQLYRQNGWFNFLGFGAYYIRTHAYSGDKTDESGGVFIGYQGPLQSYVQLTVADEWVLVQGNGFDQTGVTLQASFKPTAWFTAASTLAVGKSADFVTPRLGDLFRWAGFSRLSIGRGISLQADHTHSRLAFHGENIFTADLFQSKVVYQFSNRSLVRGIIQYRAVDRNPALNPASVAVKDRGLFGQFLFSYKVNPQTVLFLGYSDNATGSESYDLTRTGRTFFTKIGYAWRP